MNALKTTLAAILFVSAPAMVAQDIYDDIYGGSSSTTAKAATPVAQTSTVSTASYSVPAPKTKRVNEIDIDSYNRRGIFADATAQTAAADTTVQEDFAMTKRIERFYDPEVVSGSNDSSLIVIYNQPIDININVETPGYFGVTSWAWDPWWWGPSWRWSWGWGPGWLIYTTEEKKFSGLV